MAAACALGCGGGAEPDDVVLIVVDTLRWSRLPLSGYPRDLTPQLDRFAADAVVFEQARAVASWTRPTVASILTGYDPRQHGARRYDEGLRPVPTLATRLGQAGYTSRAVVANPFLDRAGFERGFHAFENLADHERWHVPGRDVTRAAIAAVPDRPRVFLYVHYLDPHDPYRPDEEAARARVRPYEGPADGGMGFVRGQLLSGRYQPTEADVTYLSDLYDAEIQTVDAALGELLDWLRTTGRYERAWIVVTADHGEELHDRGGWLHSYTLYEEQLHVPLLIKAPARLGIAPGRRGGLVSQTDVVPTLLEGLGLARKAADPGAPALAGRSLLDRMRDPASGDGGRVLFAEQRFGRRDGPRGIGYTGRRGHLKWIQVDGEYSHHPTPPHGECYDLARDPGERRNLARADGDHPCRELARAVEGWRREERAEGVALDVPEETETHLRELGYTP